MEKSFWTSEQERIILEAISKAPKNNQTGLANWYNETFPNAVHKLDSSRISGCLRGTRELEGEQYVNLCRLCERDTLYRDTNPENTATWLLDELLDAIHQINKTDRPGVVHVDTYDDILDFAKKLVGAIKEYGPLSPSNRELLGQIVNELEQIPMSWQMDYATEWNFVVTQLRLCQLDVAGWKQRTLQLLDAFESMKPNQRDDALVNAIISFSEDEKRSILYSLLRSDRDCFLYRLFSNFAGTFFDRAIRGEEEKLYRENSWNIYECFRERLYTDFKEQMFVDFEDDLQE